MDINEQNINSFPHIQNLKLILELITIQLLLNIIIAETLKENLTSLVFTLTFRVLALCVTEANKLIVGFFIFCSINLQEIIIETFLLLPYTKIVGWDDLFFLEPGEFLYSVIEFWFLATKSKGIFTYWSFWNKMLLWNIKHLWSIGVRNTRFCSWFPITYC